MKKQLAVNPYINEFLYDVLFNATTEEKRSVPKRYMKKIKTASAAKQFCNKSVLEEKLEVFSALGMGWTIVLFNKTRKQKTVNQMFEKLKSTERKDYINVAMENGMYLMSDRHFAYFQGLMADQTNHGIFSQNLLLNKAGFHIGGWKKKINSGETVLAKEHAEVSKYLVETVLNTAINLEYMQGMLELTPNDFKVLCYLYTRYHVYVSYSEILQRFSGNMSMNKVTGCLRRLSQNNHVQKPPNPNTKEYQITAIGIKSVNTFWRLILKANEIQ